MLTIKTSLCTARKQAFYPVESCEAGLALAVFNWGRCVQIFVQHGKKCAFSQLRKLSQHVVIARILKGLFSEMHYKRLGQHKRKQTWNRRPKIEKVIYAGVEDIF